MCLDVWLRTVSPPKCFPFHNDKSLRQWGRTSSGEANNRWSRDRWKVKGPTEEEARADERWRSNFSSGQRKLEGCNRTSKRCFESGKKVIKIGGNPMHGINNHGAILNIDGVKQKDISKAADDSSSLEMEVVKKPDVSEDHDEANVNETRPGSVHAMDMGSKPMEKIMELDTRDTEGTECESSILQSGVIDKVEKSVTENSVSLGSMNMELSVG
ncbi:hypothetical protein LWI29_020510 [Acer saccharum]|uniref:Uncharacterized protein n=1 Tax=Acer saccharum TaxID=4024 RepID=A0AA39V8X0_ACESA|nr:hypothetical protein LWI29_020510 [Acer saccharum]